ncbi:MAG: multiple sugar transport system permease protein [Thermomicrobiales bacterium]|nr:multiple sugar transport system permease protein [Thermomicrobiales bacterium]
MTRRERHNLGLGLLFISPWLVGFVVFLVYPIIDTIRISFTRYSGFGSPEWIGLDNYRQIIHDDVFWTAVYNTLYYTALAVPLGVVVAMVLALAMNQPLPEVPIFRAIIYIPSVIPLFTLAFVYQILMSPTKGIFNQILIFFGLPNINWFGDPRYAKIALVLLAQYGAGQAAIVFLAALKGIPTSLYEAASLDGATSWRRFWNITLPLMTPVILYDIILGLSLGLQIFTQVYILSGVPPGGPANSTMVYVLYLYLNAFNYSALGFASAMAWILFVITLLIALVIFRSSKWWVNYETI